MRLKHPLILASSSPQRSKLLGQIGIEHTIFAVDCHEDMSLDEPSHEMVERITKSKMAAALEQIEPGRIKTSLILCSDTIVSLDEHRLGKPQSREQAESYLRLLSNRSHEVLTGITLYLPSEQASVYTYSQTRVRFKDLSAYDYQYLLDSGDWMGAAGAYKIQAAASAVITNIEGSYTGVIGLPLEILYELLLTHKVLA